MKKYLLALLSVITINAFAQSFDLGRGISYSVEMSGTVSDGDNAPLWLSANKQGVNSTNANSAYERASVFRDIATDSSRVWKRGYGLDIMLSQNATSTFLIHQAFFEATYKKINITAGAKEREIDLRNNDLTSGGLSLGINSTPIPQALVYVDYFSVPYTNQWWKFRGRMGYGMTTDGRWQRTWVAPDSKRTSNILYHEKALYTRIGREDKFPLTYEIGIQMFAQFGGTSYNITGRNYHDKKEPLKNSSNLKAFWHAFWPMGSDGDVTDGTQTNVSGNQLGSYNMALQWKGRDWHVRGYFERFFEDHSMLTVQYGIYDHLVGIDASLPSNKFISNVLVEHLSTKDQSGPVYHDPTSSMPDAIAGIDNYYNHNNYTGWQHWGMTIGNPLITSPIYNSPHHLTFYNNRIQAWHIGLSGNPNSEVSWKMLMSFTKNWGTYNYPFADVKKQQYYMLEVRYAPKRLHGWYTKLALGLDHGTVIGNSIGAQLSIHKTGILTNK